MLSDSEYSQLANQAKRIGKPAVSAFLTLVSKNADYSTIREALAALSTTIIRYRSLDMKGEGHMRITAKEFDDLIERARRIGPAAVQDVERRAAAGDSFDAILKGLLDRVAPARPNVRHFTDIDDDTFIRSLTHPVEDRLG